MALGPRAFFIIVRCLRTRSASSAPMNGNWNKLRGSELYNVRAYHVFSVAQPVERDRLRFVIALIFTRVYQILIRLKVVEKDHRNASGIHLDELA